LNEEKRSEDFSSASSTCETELQAKKDMEALSRSKVKIIRVKHNNGVEKAKYSLHRKLARQMFLKNN
jgi:hypothetical protein